MQDTEQAHRFLIMAEKDLQAVSGMLDVDIFPVEVFGFHVQQATEKILKGWLCYCGIIFPKIHDLDELSSLLSDNEISIPKEYAHLLAFTDFAVTFRYDVYLEIDEGIDRKQISQDAASLFAYVKAIVTAQR